MSDNKVQMNTRLSPQLHAYLKQRAPANVSAYMEELVRKDALDNIEYDAVARITQQVLKQDILWERVDAYIRQEMREY